MSIIILPKAARVVHTLQKWRFEESQIWDSWENSINLVFILDFAREPLMDREFRPRGSAHKQIQQT